MYAAPYRYYRPYYSFRPRFSVGFGLWIGYPVAYTASFYYGYPYPGYYGYPAYALYAPANTRHLRTAIRLRDLRPAIRRRAIRRRATRRAALRSRDTTRLILQQGSVIAQPGTASGSVSFEITPSTAEVYIDGKYVGRVSDLGPTTQPLALTPGRHKVEIRAAGYQTLSFDADVVAGQVVPYRGTMAVTTLAR